MALVEFFNPNYWAKQEHEFRIYGDDYENVYAIVDEIDYHYLIQWRWRPKASRMHKSTKRPKVYLYRPGHEQLGSDVYEDGKRTERNRRQSSIFLHQVVIDRKGDVKPKIKKRIIIDHANGNGLDCRRHNLRYATISFNNKNLYGCHEHGLHL